MLSADNQQGRFIGKNMLNPNYISGFVDGEGSFHVAIYKDNRMKHNIKIIPEFHISQRKDSKMILEKIKDYLQCGYIKKNHAKNKNDLTYVYVVRNRKDLLEKIIPFFEKYTLKTVKKKDYNIFAKIVELMNNNRHSKKSGLRKIIKLSYSMNRKGKYRRSKISL